MNIIVVGCGRVGSELASALEALGHGVTVVDKSAAAFRRLPADFGGATVVGVGFDRATLTEAGIDRADAVAAVTNGDNSNILIARVARETFGVDNVAARIYDPRRAEIYQRLGITTVATVAWATDQILRRLLPGRQRPDWIDASGEICLVERRLPDHWAGRKLDGLNEPGRFIVTGMSRLGVGSIVTSGTVGQEGDILFFSARSDALDAIDTRLAEPEGKAH